MWTFWKKIVSWQKLRQCLPFHLGRSFPRISRIIPADNGSCREWAFADHNTNCLGGTFAACALHLVTIAKITTVTWSDPKLTCTGDCTDPVCCALLWRINLWQSIINEFPKGAWHCWQATLCPLWCRDRVLHGYADPFVVVHPAQEPNGGVSSEVFFDLPQASAETLWAACETVSGGGIVCLVLPPQLTLKLGLHFIKAEVDALFLSDHQLSFFLRVLNKDLQHRLPEKNHKMLTSWDKISKIWREAQGKILSLLVLWCWGMIAFPCRKRLWGWCCQFCQDFLWNMLTDQMKTRILPIFPECSSGGAIRDCRVRAKTWRGGLSVWWRWRVKDRIESGESVRLF